MKKIPENVDLSETLVPPDKMERLITTIQELSLARDLHAITKIVRHEARVLTGADGATFILRDNDKCYYVDEEAISPLWKGKRFPMSNCISGWVMLNRQPAIIKDIYRDERIPIDAYKPTFVKSLVVVPIRTRSPVGAIGNYWAKEHLPTKMELSMLQALADSTSIAMENINLISDLENQLEEYKLISEKLKSSLGEKEVLLREVYHRVKNNLQVVTSLLNLQSATIGDIKSKSILIDSMNRINAMSVLHEMLYQSSNKAKIIFSEYIDNLINHVYKVSAVDMEYIKFHGKMDHIVLSLDQAIPCGLIINELVTNIFKHAYPDGQKGVFNLTIKLEGNQVNMKMSDTGVGMPNGSAQNGKALGLKLVDSLTKQLGGSLKISVDKGTSVEVFFPVREI